VRKEEESIFDRLNPIEVMALTIYGEARGESWEGMLAVGFVIVNRSRLWKQSIKEVCFAKNQFSCYNSNDPQYCHMLSQATYWKHTKEEENDTMLVAQTALYGWNESTVGDATFYRVIGNKNKWFDGQIKKGKLIKVCDIGHHEFYKEAL
jgi:N-acetylmuramoyl-L-alanine amidase